MRWVEGDDVVPEPAPALLLALGCEIVQAVSGDAVLAPGCAAIDAVPCVLMVSGSLDGIALAFGFRARCPKQTTMLAGGHVLAPERPHGWALEFM